MSEPDRVTEHARIADHAQRAVDALMAVLRSKDRVSALASTIGARAQVVEDALWAVLTISIDSSVGAALDQIGELVGQLRGALDDTDYRPVLRAAIRARRSRGTGPDVIAVVKLALGATPFAWLAGGASVCVELEDVPPFDPQVLADLVEIAVGAGIGYCVVAPVGDVADAFTFSDDSLLAVADGARGFGDDLSPGSGGELAGAYV